MWTLVPSPREGSQPNYWRHFSLPITFWNEKIRAFFSPFDAGLCISTEIDLLLYNKYNMPNANQVEYNKIKPVKGTRQSHFNHYCREVLAWGEIRQFVDILSSEQRPSLFRQLVVILCHQTDFHTFGFGRLHVIEDYRNEWTRSLTSRLLQDTRMNNSKSHPLLTYTTEASSQGRSHPRKV